MHAAQSFRSPQKASKVLASERIYCRPKSSKLLDSDVRTSKSCWIHNVMKRKVLEHRHSRHQPLQHGPSELWTTQIAHVETTKPASARKNDEEIDKYHTLVRHRKTDRNCCIIPSSRSQVQCSSPLAIPKVDVASALQQDVCSHFVTSVRKVLGKTESSSCKPLVLHTRETHHSPVAVCCIHNFAAVAETTWSSCRMKLKLVSRSCAGASFHRIRNFSRLIK